MIENGIFKKTMSTAGKLIVVHTLEVNEASLGVLTLDFKENDICKLTSACCEILCEIYV